MLYVSFSPTSLASLECTLACMSAYLPENSTIILILMVVKSLKPVFIPFFKTVPFSCIRIDPLNRYHFLVPIDPLYLYYFPV